MNKSEIKEIKAFYSSKNKKSKVSVPEIHTEDFRVEAMTFFNSVINKLKINNSTSKK